MTHMNTIFYVLNGFEHCNVRKYESPRQPFYNTIWSPAYHGCITHSGSGTTHGIMCQFRLIVLSQWPGIQ